MRAGETTRGYPARPGASGEESLAFDMAKSMTETDFRPLVAGFY